MKKAIFTVLILLAFAVSQLFVFSPAKSATYKITSQIQLVVNYPLMKVDGLSFEVDPGRGTSPIIVKEWGRTLVPVRGLVEAVGGTVAWNNQLRMVAVQLLDRKVELFIGKPKAFVNGKEIWIDENKAVCPIIINSRTMVPVRFLVENLGGDVQYDERNFKIEITLNKEVYETKDMVGKAVTVPAKVYRIVSLDSMISQFLFAVNAQDLIVSARFGPAVKGPALAKIYPRALEIKDPGTPDTVSIEYLLSLRPDLILTNDGKMVEKMREVGLPVFVLDRESPENIIKCISLMGRLIGKNERAEEVNSYFIEKLSYMKGKTKEMSEDGKARVYVSGSKLLSTFGKDYFQTYMVGNAGGVSVSGNVSGGKIDISLEKLLEWNPDVIILTAYTPESVNEVLSNSSLSTLNAVKNRRVYKLPSYIVSWDTPVPESFLGTMWIANKLYPQEIGFDMEKEIKEFYLKLYNFKIPQEDLQKLVN